MVYLKTKADNRIFSKFTQMLYVWENTSPPPLPSSTLDERRMDGRRRENFRPTEKKEEEKTNKRSANSGAKKKPVRVVFPIPMRIEARDLY